MNDYNYDNKIPNNKIPKGVRGHAEHKEQKLYFALLLSNEPRGDRAWQQQVGNTRKRE